MSTSPLLRVSSRPLHLKHHRSRLGFSLMELLTVVAIIGILAAILFPVLQKSRQSAQNSRCVANLHQVGLAIQNYATDNKGVLPSTGFFGVSPYYNRDPRNFENQILPYLSLMPATGWSTSDFTQMVHAAVLDCPGYKGSTGGKCYVLQQTVTASDGTQYKPWGLVADVYGTVKPKPLLVSTLPATAWAMRDYDASATDGNHSGHQNYLYFDWHVGAVAVNN